jgi:sugar phosphate isomerase/epimerase
MDQIAEVVEGAASLGAERLILSGSPVADEGSPMDPQRLLWKAGALNRAGRSGYDNRIRVCYRNHGPEFASGAEEITALMKETDGDVVHFVLDAGDAIRAKADIAAFFSKYHKRIDGLHLRDFDAKDVQVPLGQGTFQYEPLALAVKKAKWVGWVIAEEERDNGEKPGEAAARPAREQIRKLFGV